MTSSISPHILKGVISSAGSKVMLTGGYLVLHKPNNGLVMGVDARLHTSIYSFPSLPTTFHQKSITIKQYQNNVTSYPIIILTPQLRQEPLFLELLLKENTITSLSSSSTTTLSSPFEFEIIGEYAKNSFASKSIHYSLIAISSLLSKDDFLSIISNGLLIDIRGDRSFYSSQPVQNQNIIPSQTIQIDSLSSTPITTEPIIEENPNDYTTKTGLGSSAAVVSSLVSALFTFFNLIPLSSSSTTATPTLPTTIPISSQMIKTYAYRVAQIAHCIAQGKVGSGFDVATAFYGTQTYCRFSPKLLSQLMDKPLENADEKYRFITQDDNNILVKENIQKPNPFSLHDGNNTFLTIMTQDWDDEVKPFKLPKYLNLILADVQGGSETPGMVKMVEEWKKTGGENATKLWNSIANANHIIEQHFLQLDQIAENSPQEWLEVLELCSTLPSHNWSSLQSQLQPNAIQSTILTQMIQVVNDFALVRQLLRQMGNECNVPIEPPSQTALIDLTCQQNGVLFGGVPGAGGYDAVFAVIIQTPTKSNIITTQIINCWKNFTTNESTSIIHQLPVSIDPNGGVQSRIVYKDFSQWF